MIITHPMELSTLGRIFKFHNLEFRLYENPANSWRACKSAIDIVDENGEQLVSIRNLEFRTRNEFFTFTITWLTKQLDDYLSWR